MEKRFINALKACAKAHGAECRLYDDDPDDMQFCINSASVPVVADVEMIAEAFFGSTRPVYVDRSWGVTTVYFATSPFLDKVDEVLLSMALPSGVEI